MNREIKFRAWNTDRKKMITSFDGITQNSIGDSTTHNLRLLSSSYSGADMFRPNWGRNVILMQYTGLRDKNGVEIYEGDIIKNIQADVNEVFWYNEEPSFCYRNYHAEALPLGCDSNATMEGELFTQDEVIGNIYENPELLNQ